MDNAFETAYLWAAVDQLTKPRHVKLLRDDDTTDWTTLPSLWWQLEDALRTGLENSTHSSGSKYRTPLNIDALQLASDIRDTTTDALDGHGQKPRATFPESVRALASVVVAAMDGDLTGWWVYRVRSWSRQIDHVLRLTEQPQPRRIRDTRCPTCQATHVTIIAGVDGTERVPALLIDFADGMIRAASCSACGSTWFRGDALLALTDQLNEQPAPAYAELLKPVYPAGDTAAQLGLPHFDDVDQVG